MTDIAVTIDNQGVTSQYETSVVHIKSAELLYGNAAAVAAAKTAVASAIKYQRSYLSSGGVSDPWPWDGTGEEPQEPDNWSSLDAQLSAIRAMDSEPILTTHLYEWWHKAVTNTSAVTTAAIYPDDQFTETGRIVTERMADELHRIEVMADRYLRAPYNVRYFVTGIEYHGYSMGSTSANGSGYTFNRLAYHAYAGTAERADMGAAYYHNQVAQKIVDVADGLGIARSELKFGPNYPRIYTDAAPTAQSVSSGHPLYGRPYGTADKRGLDALELGLPLIDPDLIDFVPLDFGMKNQSGGAITDDWTNMQRYSDFPLHVRDILTSIGLGALPIMIAEKYARPQADGVEVDNADLRAVIEADAQCRMVKAGVWTGSQWGFRGENLGTGSAQTEGSALITDVAEAGGGQPLPVLDVLQTIHRHFGPGTRVFALDSDESVVDGLASHRMLFLYNKSDEAVTVRVREATIPLAAYGRVLMTVPPVWPYARRAAGRRR